jgi:hypothetical protein
MTQPTEAETIAELTELIEADLLRRFARAAPRDRIMIAATAALAAQLRRLDLNIIVHGTSSEMVALHARGVESLLRNLHALGTGAVADTVAEQTLVKAMATQLALTAAMPAQGSA